MHGNVRSGAAAAALLIGLLLVPAGCETGARREGYVQQVAGGDARLAPASVRRYGCIDCHTIPGIKGANTWFGPPLTHWARRVFIAGLVPNTPDNLVRWIQDPQQIHPGSAMPNTGVTLDDARHIAAYLYTIR